MVKWLATYGLELRCMKLNRVVQSSTKQYRAVQCSTKQYRAVQSSTEQYRAVQSSTAVQLSYGREQFQPQGTTLRPRVTLVSQPEH